jgi:hypothetical protein
MNGAFAPGSQVPGLQSNSSGNQQLQKRQPMQYMPTLGESQGSIPMGQYRSVDGYYPQDSMVQSPQQTFNTQDSYQVNPQQAGNYSGQLAGGTDPMGWLRNQVRY